MNVYLQPLRIPAGWLVAYNDGFYELDPQSACVSETDRLRLFKEDMLQMKHLPSNRLLDLGWYPAGDLTTGIYTVVVYDTDFSGRLLHEFRTTDRPTLVAEIERLFVTISNGEL